MSTLASNVDEAVGIGVVRDRLETLKVDLIVFVEIMFEVSGTTTSKRCVLWLFPMKVPIFEVLSRFPEASTDDENAV